MQPLHIATAAAASLAVTSAALAAPLNLDFDDGTDGWRVVLDGVMGGLSSGRIGQLEPGVLRFSGDLSLENNGGFSQIRTNVPGGSLADAAGVELRVRGDGRTYQFDIRVSNVRLMAGGFQAQFETTGDWQTVRIPFDRFGLYNFGRAVRNAPALDAALIESLGVTLGDKKPGPFELSIDYVRALPGGSESAAPSGDGTDLVSVARGAGLTTLLQLADAAGIELPAGERFTILAPTNDAFAALPAAEVEKLLTPEGLPTLRRILAQHVIPTALSSTALLDRRAVASLTGQRLAINGDALTIGGASLLATDVPFDSGVVHVIDRVLVPELRTVSERIADDAELGTLYAAVEAAGLLDQLGPRNEGPWTLLAPSNDAFAALGSETIDALLADPSKLVPILAAHVIPGRVRRVDMLGQGSARTLMGGDPVAFALTDGRVTANGARLLTSDLEASNGVIHIIDRVLLPETPVSPTGNELASAGNVIAVLERAIERGVPLFNDGSPEACAAIYEVSVQAIVDLSPESIGSIVRADLERALAEIAGSHDARANAWTLRRAMDRAYAALSQRSRLAQR